MDKRAVLRDTTYYLAAMYLSQALYVARGFLNARSLGPPLYGFWGSLTFLLSFGFHLHGGVQDILVKEIPTYRSRGQLGLARRAFQIAFTFFFMMLLGATTLIWLSAWRLPPETPSLIRWGWWVGGLTLPLEALYFFEQTVARSEERFGQIGRQLVLTSFISLLLTCGLVVSYGLPGLFIVSVLTPAIGLWFLRRHNPTPWRFLWSWPKLRLMLKAGWPILAMTLIFESLWWIDRLVVLRFLGTTHFGYYGLAATVTQLCFLFPKLMASVIEPRIYFDHARCERSSQVREHLWFLLKTQALLMPAVLLGIDLLLPLFIQRWLPAYTPSITAMRLLVWGSFFMGLAICTKPVIIAVGKQFQALTFYGLAIGVNLLTSVALVLHGAGLWGAALGTGLAYGTCCAGLLLFSFRKLEWSGREAATRLGLLMIPWGIALGLTFASTGLFRVAGVVSYGVAAVFFVIRQIRTKKSAGSSPLVEEVSSLVTIPAAEEISA